MNSQDTLDSTLVSDAIAFAPCSIELPAGAGKTHLIASIAKFSASQGKSVLVLTHTNAGVAVIKSRLRNFEVDSSLVSVATICSWSEKISLAYPLLSGVDWTISHDDKNYYDMCVSCATRLCSVDAIASILVDSYSLILIDEYQDCDIIQHQLAIELMNVLGNVIVFGDRLQRIFDFGKVRFPDWESEVCRDFKPFKGIVPRARRWEHSNIELGKWLLEDIRPTLLAGRCPDFDIAIKGLKHISRAEGTKDKDKGIIDACYGMGRSANSMAVLCPNIPLPRSLKLAKRLGGSFEYREEIEGRFSKARLLQYTECTSSREIVDWIATLAKDCFSSLSSVLDRPVSNAIIAGKSMARLKNSTARKDYAPLLDALEAAAENFNLDTFTSLRDSFKACCGRHLVRSTAWNNTLNAVEAHLSYGASPLDTIESLSQSTRFRSAEKQRRFVSRVLLVKGLEFEDVIIVDASKAKAYSKENLYVALTRPTKRLVVFD